MKNVGAAKVMTTTGPFWCHFLKQDGTLKIRSYSDGTIFERTVEDDEIEELVSLKECMKLVSAKSYSYKNIETGDFSTLKKKYAKGVELRGKTLGIIGFGRIGQSLASYVLIRLTLFDYHYIF